MHITSYWLHLSLFANEAFQAQSEFRNYKDRKKDLKRRSATATYSFAVIELEILLFSFVCSVPQSLFVVYNSQSFYGFVWGNVAIVSNTRPFKLHEVYIPVWHEPLISFCCRLIVKGHFTIKKTERIFSAIGIDQAHKQNNKSMKIDGGAIGILDNEQALL